MRSPLSALTAHLTKLNRHDPTKFTRLWTNTAAKGWRVIGWVRPDAAEAARSLGDGWRTDEHGLFLPAAALEPASRAAAVNAALEKIGGSVPLPGRRHELYPVLPSWGEDPLFAIDRAFVPVLGLKAFGVHVNGLTETESGAPLVWIATRSMDRGVEPGKRDNLIAGGQPFGLTLEQNLAKEAQEEAGVGEALIKTAKPAGFVRYAMETEEGLKPDTLFLYDLAVPADFTPHNQDGEIAAFERMDFDHVRALVAETETVKFNVNLVLIDLLLRRHALSLDPRQQAALAAALRPDHPF